MKRADVPEMKLDGLINKIRTEGVEEANRQADMIIAEAREKADALIENARNEADAHLKKASRTIEQQMDAGKKAIELAVRDSLISLKNTIRGILESLVRNDFERLMTGDVLENLLLKTIEGWSRNRDVDADLEILLSEKERDSLSQAFIQRLGKTLKGGVELKVHPGINAGFRIGERDGHVHYDLTDESVQEILIAHLNKELASIFNAVKSK